ncbi:AAA family ATPase [Marixanthomonas spongiae]|uniref:Nicotinate-nucleotide adenylyltransferase n=1 Tax=Marixanthomonas spongiae TaxID=2174845 RepID=A0A2U0I2L8_9FLAO|nr:ATP-binding protein [Marixanthomonas spongiae]PVW15355.1 nicotinate-nucleotide adenylyltransferase [Marixanthomonas spongiae]
MEKTLEQSAGNGGHCLKIVLYGPESTGKTTLAKQLAAHYNTLWVPEYMRSYLEEKWESEREMISRDDLLPIAKGQMALENKLAKKANRLLFCDTNLLELKVYSEYYYNGFCPSELKRAAQKNHYHHYFLTYIDVPWEADRLRDRPHDRMKMFSIFEAELRNQQLPYTVLKGSVEQRMKAATKHIERLLNT